MSDRLAERLSLIVITDAACGPERTIVDVVRAALRGGAPAIQVRDKTGGGREMLELTRALLPETRNAGALLFVNDRVDVAIAGGADGAHVGADDLPVDAVRRIAPGGFIIGRSVDTPGEAVMAQRAGADYVGVGPVFSTPSKTDTGPAIGLAGVQTVRDAVGVPVVAIGGIDAENTASIAAAGADGVAVIRAVMQAEAPDRAAERLIRAVEAGLRSRHR